MILKFTHKRMTQTPFSDNLYEYESILENSIS